MSSLQYLATRLPGCLSREESIILTLAMYHFWLLLLPLSLTLNSEGLIGSVPTQAVQVAMALTLYCAMAITHGWWMIEWMKRGKRWPRACMRLWKPAMHLEAPSGPDTLCSLHRALSTCCLARFWARYKGFSELLAAPGKVRNPPILPPALICLAGLTEPGSAALCVSEKILTGPT